MRKRISSALIVTIVSLLSAPIATSMKIEPIFSYQGFLTDSSGAPLNGVFDMNFRIMDSPDILWEEFHGGVQVNDGFFNVVLGEIDPIPPDAFVAESDSGEYVMRYLEVQVGADPPMSPTARLLTVPYSVGAHRVAGDIFTIPGAIHIQPPEPCQPPDPCFPTIELQALAESTKFVMLGPNAGPGGGSISEINVNPYSASFKMGVEPEPFEPTVELNTNINTTTFRIGVEPFPYQPSAVIIAGQNATEFSLGIEPQPFNPAPEMEMVMDQNSTTFRMGVDSQPSNPSVQLQALADAASFTMFDPSAGNDDKRVSEMNAITGGQFNWTLSLPDANSSRPVMDMNTGQDGAMDWTIFYPKNLEPNKPAMKITTWADSGAFTAGSYLTLFHSPYFTPNYPAVSLISETGNAAIFLHDPLTGSATVSLTSGPSSYITSNLGVGTTSTDNILQVAFQSTTDPIADAWTVYSSRRWKKNIKPIDSALEKVESLQGVSFDWKADGKHDIGLIAEEVGEVIPEVVAYEENGVDAQSVDYARLVAVLIEAVKEQQAEINDLKQRMEEIEMKNKLSMGALNK